MHPLVQTREEIELKSNSKNKFDLEGESSPPKFCPKDPYARLEAPRLQPSFNFYGNKLESSKQQLKNMRFHIRDQQLTFADKQQKLHNIKV